MDRRDSRLIKCLRERQPTDMTVYDAAALGAVIPLGVRSVYGALFGSGHLLFGHQIAGTIGMVTSIAGAAVLVRQRPRLWRA